MLHNLLPSFLDPFEGQKRAPQRPIFQNLYTKRRQKVMQLFCPPIAPQSLGFLPNGYRIVKSNRWHFCAQLPAGRTPSVVFYNNISKRDLWCYLIANQ